MSTITTSFAYFLLFFSVKVTELEMVLHSADMEVNLVINSSNQFRLLFYLVM